MIFSKNITPKTEATKGKISGLHQTKKLLHSKGNNQQNESQLWNEQKYLQTIYLIIYLIKG